MKLIISFLTFTTGVIFATDPTLPADLTTTKGKVYHGVKLMTVEPDGVKLSHEAGVVKVPYDQLPAEVRAAFPHDPAKAEAFKASQRAASENAAAAHERQVMADNKISGATQAEQAEKEANMTPVVRITAVSSGGRSTVPTWVTNYGSGGAAGSTTRNLYVTLVTLARKPVPLTVEVLWIVQNLTSGGVEVVKGDKTKITCLAAVEGHWVTQMAAEDMQDVYAALGYQTTSGFRYKGWVIRAKDKKNTVCAIASSLPEYAKYAGVE